MTQHRMAATIGEMAEIELEAALRTFSAELRGTPTRDEVYALHIRTVEQTWVRFPGGLFNITTTVRGVRRIDDLAAFAKYTISTQGGRGSTYHA